MWVIRPLPGPGEYTHRLPRLEETGASLGRTPMARLPTLRRKPYFKPQMTPEVTGAGSDYTILQGQWVTPLGSSDLSKSSRHRNVSVVIKWMMCCRPCWGQCCLTVQMPQPTPGNQTQTTLEMPIGHQSLSSTQVSVLLTF